MKKYLIIFISILAVVLTFLTIRYFSFDTASFLPGSNDIEYRMIFDYHTFEKYFETLDEISQRDINQELFKRLITASLSFLTTMILILVLIFKQRKIKKSHQLLEESNTLINAQKLELDKMIKTRDHLFSIIAHDLRGPIGNLSVMLEFQYDKLKSKIDTENLEILKKLQQVSERTFYLLENLLRWASLQRNSINVEIKANNLTEVILNSVELIKNQDDQKDVKIRIESPTNIKVDFDKDMILLVLRNLLVNALKFSNEGGEIVVKAEAMGLEVQIEVKDEGIGMTPDEIDRILNPEMFYSKKGTKNEEGSGLGLKLCQEFIARNGGRLVISSIPDVGSSFSFALPLTDETQEKSDI
jgi:two-component system sensor histidine kinase/response regulator